MASRRLLCTLFESFLTYVPIPVFMSCRIQRLIFLIHYRIDVRFDSTAGTWVKKSDGKVGRKVVYRLVAGWVILSGRQTSVIIQFWALETGSVTPLSQVLTTRIEINTNPPELTQIRNQCRESTKKSIHFCLNFEISLVPVSCVSSQVTHTNHFSMSTSSFLARPTPCKVVPPLLNEVGGVCFSFCPVLQPLGRPRPLTEISH